MPVERPTGIIRTLPSIYNGTDGKQASVGFKRYQLSLKHLKTGKLPFIYIALQAIPKLEVLHIYLLIEGQIRVRLNIAGYQPGSAQICWDTTIRTPKFWAMCTAPVEEPPDPMPMRGFQGIRYTEGLW